MRAVHQGSDEILPIKGPGPPSRRGPQSLREDWNGRNLELQLLLRQKDPPKKKGKKNNVGLRMTMLQAAGKN